MTYLIRWKVTVGITKQKSLMMITPPIVAMFHYVEEPFDSRKLEIGICILVLF